MCSVKDGFQTEGRLPQQKDILGTKEENYFEKRFGVLKHFLLDQQEGSLPSYLMPGKRGFRASFWQLDMCRMKVDGAKGLLSTQCRRKVKRLCLD